MSYCSGAVLSLALLGLAGGAFAAEGVKGANNQISLSVGKEKISYTETADGNWFNSENGRINQARIVYTLQGDFAGVREVYFQGVFGYGKGRTNYDGGLMYADGSTTPYQARTRVTNNDVGIRLGKAFSLGSRVQLTPFAAYDYHQWERDLAGEDDAGYKEVYDHHALSVGLLGQLALTDRLVASAWASRGKMIRARMEYEHDTTFRLKSKPVTSWGIGLDYRVNEQFRVNAGYQENRFSYGQSPVESGMYEPDSETRLKSWYMGAGYAF